MITRHRVDCECGAPQSRVILEACRCVDVDTGHLAEAGEEFKTEQPCRPECNEDSDQCETPACQKIIRWYKMAHLDEHEHFNGTSIGANRCQRQIIKQEITNCCKLVAFHFSYI